MLNNASIHLVICNTESDVLVIDVKWDKKYFVGGQMSRSWSQSFDSRTHFYQSITHPEEPI